MCINFFIRSQLPQLSADFFLLKKSTKPHSRGPSLSQVLVFEQGTPVFENEIVVKKFFPVCLWLWKITKLFPRAPMETRMREIKRKCECVCVCVWERERERAKEREREKCHSKLLLRKKGNQTQYLNNKEKSIKIRKNFFYQFEFNFRGMNSSVFTLSASRWYQSFRTLVPRAKIYFVTFWFKK